MLPSYNHTLPGGDERGRYLSLDVGGSTLRVALVELRGQGEGVKGRESGIVCMESFPIGNAVMALEGVAFFDWMAARIVETLAKEKEGPMWEEQAILPMSLAWSFPIEYAPYHGLRDPGSDMYSRQTSLRSGRIHHMGKGFRAAQGLTSQDLGSVIKAACRRAGLAAEFLVILNDGNASHLPCLHSKVHPFRPHSRHRR